MNPLIPVLRAFRAARRSLQLGGVEGLLGGGYLGALVTAAVSMYSGAPGASPAALLAGAVVGAGASVFGLARLGIPGPSWWLHGQDISAPGRRQLFRVVATQNIIDSIAKRHKNKPVLPAVAAHRIRAYIEDVGDDASRLWVGGGRARFDFTRAVRGENGGAARTPVASFLAMPPPLEPVKR